MLLKLTLKTDLGFGIFVYVVLLFGLVNADNVYVLHFQMHSLKQTNSRQLDKLLNYKTCWSRPKYSFFSIIYICSGC